MDKGRDGNADGGRGESIKEERRGRIGISDGGAGPGRAGVRGWRTIGMSAGET